MKIKNLKLNSEDQVIVKNTLEVLRAFHIEVANEYEPIDYEKFEIVNSLKDNTLKTKLIVKTPNKSRDTIFTAKNYINPLEKRAAEIHRIIKKNLYQIIIDNLNLEGVPYGIMHGVRPTKIVHRWIREGFGVTSHGVIDKDRIARRLVSDYMTSYDKSHLLAEVAVRQIPILNSGDEKTVGVYIGVPFCVSRCLYCSFPSNILPEEEKIAEFMGALTIDINAAAEEIQRYNFKVQSIYIGGGTPTALPSKFFVDMLNKVRAAFYTPSVEEFTVECGRPDTITPEKIFVMKSCRVNRVCVNPQTMQQKTLDRIGRKHSINQIYTAFNALRRVGNFKINMDLILGLPGETLDDVKDSLEKVLALKPDDITLHALAIKRGSQLQTQIADEVSTIDDFELPDDDEVRKMAEVAEKMLREEKYLPYYLYRQGYISGQIENIGYCKPGAEGIYNVQIMDERQTILGIGAAASTKVPDNENLILQTSFNAKDLTTYLRDLDKYILNRSKTLEEIYNPKPKVKPVEEKFTIEETEKVEVVKEKPAKKLGRRFRRSMPARFAKVEEVAPVEEIQPVEKIAAVEKVEPVEETETIEEKIKSLESEIKTAEEIETIEDKIKSLESEIKTSEEIESVEETETIEEKIKSLESEVETAEEIETIEESEVEKEKPAKKFGRKFRRSMPARFAKVEEVESAEEITPAEETETIEDKIKSLESEIETVEDVENIEDKIKSLESEIADAEEISTVEELEPNENVNPLEEIERIKKSLNVSDEEIFDEFLDEVLETPHEENFENVSSLTEISDEEIFDEFLEEVVKPAEEIISAAKENLPLEKVFGSDEETETVEEVENIEDKIKSLESEIETAEETETVEETETIEDKIKSLESEIETAEETGTTEEIYHVEKVEPAEEIYHVQKYEPIEEVENIEDKIKSLESEIANDDGIEIYHVEKDLPPEEIERANEIYQVEKVKPAAEIKTVDGVKTFDEIKNSNSPAEETDDTEIDEDPEPVEETKTVIPKRPKFRHKKNKKFR